MYGLGSGDWPSTDDWARGDMSQHRTRVDTTYNDTKSITVYRKGNLGNQHFLQIVVTCADSTL